MTPDRDLLDGVSARDRPQTDAWAICAEFVERIVSEARTVVGDEESGDFVHIVDWDSIWRAGDGAPSKEVAIGRIVLAASAAAHRISVHPPDTEPPSGAANGQNGASASSVTPTELVALDEIVAVTEPVVLPSEPQEPEPRPVSNLLEPVTEPVPADWEPLATMPEPETESVSAEPAVVPIEPEPVAEPMPTESVLVPTVPGPTAGQVVIPRTDDSNELDTAESPVVTGVGAVLDHEVPEVEVIPTLPDDAVSLVDHELQTAATEQDLAIRSGWYHVFTWMRNVGIIILLFVVWQLWGTDIAQHHAQSQLQNQFDAAVRSHRVPAVAGNGKGLIPATTAFGSPADGSVVARLQIPAIGVNQYVVEGTTADDLSRGPGHYTGTALPGQAGNVAIAGHRTTHGAPFNELGHLNSGNRIILTTTWGEKLTYVVSGAPQVVSPGDVGVLNYFGDNRITLTTCNPEFSSSQRLVVVGTLRRPPGAHVAMPTHVVYHVANANTASWDWSLLPLVGVEICLLLLLALSYRRFDWWFGSRTKWLVLVPIWVTGLYLLFGSLTMFLPSSI